MSRLSRYKNSFFIQLIVSYSLLALLLLALSGGVLFSKSNHLMLVELSRESQNRVESMRNYVEQTFLRRYEDVFLSKVLATLNSQSTEEIPYFLDRPALDSSYYRLTRLVNDLHTVAQANPGIHNITVDFHQTGIVVDSNYFYASEASSSEPAFIRQLESMTPERWIPRTTVSRKDVMTFVYPLPYKATGTSVKGYLYVDIDLYHLKAILANMLTPSQDELMIVGKNGQLVLNTGLSHNVESRSAIMETVLQKREQGYYLNANGNDKTVVSYSPSELSRNEWTFILVRPMNSFFLSSKKIQRDILQVGMWVLSIGLLIAILWSRRFSLPITKVIRSIKQSYGFPHHQGTDDLGLIDQTLRGMHTTISSLQGKLKDSRLNDILNGNVTEITDFSFLTERAVYTVANVQMMEGNSKAFRACMLQSVLFQAKLEIMEVNQQELNILFISSSDAAETSIKEGLESFAVRHSQELAFGAGVGSSCHSIEDIRDSYQQALDSRRYAFLEGFDRVLAFDETSRRVGVVEGLPYISFQHALKAGDREKIIRLLQQMQQMLRKPGLQLESVELSLLKLFGCLSEVIVESGLQNRLPLSENLFQSYKKETLQQSMLWMQDIALKVAEYFDSIQTHSHADIIYRLRDYMEAHMDEDISLDLLAEMAALSSKYVSTLFKEVLHISFSDYLTKIRMEKAGDLLRNESLSVTEIAGKVGFRNVQYFSTKFKAYFGVTPIQYRNSPQ